MREMLSIFAVYSPVCIDDMWEKWFEFCLEQEKKCGFNFTHLCCKTESLNPNGIRTKSRYLRTAENCIYNREKISYLGFYVLPDEFRQAVFDFKVYMGLTIDEKHGRNHCEITIENNFINDFNYQSYIDRIRTFLHIAKLEVNLLPNSQVFNYNINCILEQSDHIDKYDIIKQIFKEIN